MVEPRVKITPYANTDMVCWECEPQLWDGSWIFAPITHMKCRQCGKYMDPLDQPRRPLTNFGEGKDPLPHGDGPGDYKDEAD